MGQKRRLEMKDKFSCSKFMLICTGVGLAMAAQANAQSLRTEGSVTIKGLESVAARNERVQQSIKQGGIAGQNPACPGAHGCCVTGGPGCDNNDCCNLICDLDPFCCTTSWDGLCVSAAQANCGPDACPPPPPCDPPPPNEECETATDLGVLAPGGTVVASGVGLCANPDCASFVYGEGNLWLRFVTEGTRNIHLEYCGSVNTGGAAWGNAWLNLAQGCPCASFTVAGAFSFSCPDGNVVIDWTALPAGEYYYPILIDPANGAVGNYNISISSAEFTGFPACDDPNNHDCCVTGGPGCNDAKCCNLVCGLDPFCCNTAWDALCVDSAEANCGCVPPPVCPNPKHDCFTAGGPGCSDEKCCNIVCGLDPFCCDVAWDGLCVTAATQNCFVEPPANDNCADRLAIGEVCLLDFTTIGATTDGPAHGACIDVAGDGSVNQDIWYNYTASCTGNATISLCGSLYDTKLAVYSGNNCADLTDLTLIACNDDACGLQSEVVIAVTAGSVYKVRIGGFGAAVGNGTLTITNDGAPCGGGSGCTGDLDGDDDVDVDDLLGVINNWGACD
jgi:hypothetical protein